jgi:hypothetical protein
MPRKLPSPHKLTIAYSVKQWVCHCCQSSWREGLKEFGQLRLRERIWLERTCLERSLLFVLVIFWILVPLTHFYLRGVSQFEGSLITKAMSFVYKGTSDKQLISSLDINGLIIKGKQQPIILKGKFSSDDPKLQIKLQSMKQLKIELTHENTKLILEPNIQSINTKNSIIMLDGIDIPPNTCIEQLNYKTISNQLQFSVDFPESDSGKCRSKTVTALSKTGDLKFSVNPIEYNFILHDGKIPSLNTELTSETSLKWIPKEQTFNMPLTSPTTLEIRLPKIDKNSSEEEIEAINNLIRGDIAVRDVQFWQIDRSDSGRDNIQKSGILDGEVRMIGQSLKLQPGQFLIIPTEQESDKFNCRMSPVQHPGIERIRDIHLNLRDPKGLQTSISGKSRCLAIGLYREFPLQYIEHSWLQKYFPQEIINAIYTLMSAITGYLIPQIFVKKD